MVGIKWRIMEWCEYRYFWDKRHHPQKEFMRFKKIRIKKMGMFSATPSPLTMIFWQYMALGLHSTNGSSFHPTGTTSCGYAIPLYPHLYLYTFIHTYIHYITLHYITQHNTTQHYTTLHYITLHYTTLHYTTLHYITLHYITYTYI